MTDNFLTIGQLARLSGVGVKALRYYESIGILEPSYIDEANKYRYYSPSYMTYVQVIKLCARYGLPLKDFSCFHMSRDTIDMAALVREAKKALDAKQAELDQDRAYLMELEKQLAIAHQVDQEGHHHLEREDTCYVLLPFKGDILSPAYYEAVQKAKATVSRGGLLLTNQFGLYYRRDAKGDWQTHLACGVYHVKEAEVPENLQLICWAQAHVHADHVTREGVRERVAVHGLEAFLLLETYESPYHLDNPHLELRYTLPAKNLSGSLDKQAK